MRVMQELEAVVCSGIVALEGFLYEGFREIAVAATQIKDVLLLKEGREQFLDPRLDGIARGGEGLRVAVVEALV